MRTALYGQHTQQHSHSPYATMPPGPDVVPASMGCTYTCLMDNLGGGGGGYTFLRHPVGHPPPEASWGLATRTGSARPSKGTGFPSSGREDGPGWHNLRLPSQSGGGCAPCRTLLHCGWAPLGCKGEAGEDWCPFEVLDRLRDKPFCPGKRTHQGPSADEGDRSLMLCAVSQCPSQY